MKLTDADKADLERLQPVQEVLRMLTVSLCALNPAATGKVAHMLRSSTAHEGLTPVARTMLWDLAEGIQTLAGSGTPGH